MLNKLYSISMIQRCRNYQFFKNKFKGEASIFFIRIVVYEAFLNFND